MKLKKGLKQGIIMVIGGLLIISSLKNIFNQWWLITEAQKRNQKIGNNIDNLRLDIENLEKKIKWATGSAYLEQQARNELGLGTKDDYWIVAGEQKTEELYPEVKVEEGRLVLSQWIDWFTR
jgi:hypothetical protein